MRRGWKPHLPLCEKVALLRDRRGQDARAPRGVPPPPTRSTRSTRLIFPGALAEGLDQSEFNPLVHGLGVGGRCSMS